MKIHVQLSRFAGWCSIKDIEYFIFGAWKIMKKEFFTLEISETTVFQPTTSFVGSNIFCQGDSVAITSDSAGSYLWNDAMASTNRTIYIKDSAQYFVDIGADTLGCFRVSPPIQATVLANPEPNIGPDTIFLH